MGIEIVQVTDASDIVRLPLTGSTGGFGNCRITHYVHVADVAGGIVGAVTNIWSNPEAVPILIFRIVINPSSASGNVGSYMRVGAAADATTAAAAGARCIDGIDTNVATGWYDNCFGPATLGVTAVSPILYMNEADAATLSFLNMESLAFSCATYLAEFHIFYFPLV